MTPLPSRDQRHPWLRYQVKGYDEDIVHNYDQRIETIWGRSVNQELFTSHAWRRLFEIRALLVREFILEFLYERYEDGFGQAGFGAYSHGSERVIPDKGDIRDYWMEISFDKDFLGPAPLMFSFETLMDQGTANVPYLLAQYLFRHAKGRKSGTRLSGGHVIGCLTTHFGLVNHLGLRGLSVVTRELPLIDLHELGRINICLRIGDSWAWVALGPERQPDATVGTSGATEDAPAADEGALIQHPFRHLSHRHLPPGQYSRGFPGSRRRYRSCDRALWGCEEMLLD
ncbi:hypothetical protein Tco_0567828, partial [Tanacetum coccineum]